MNKTSVFLSVIVLVLLVIISMLLPQIRTSQAEINEAREFSGTVKRLLTAIDVRCTARTNDFAGMEACIDPVLRKNDFKVDLFKEFDERRNETGSFVILNEGARTYDGSAFVLSKNGVKIAQGCHIQTSILPDYTCRFAIEESCEPGDVFEITYVEEESIRLVTETC